MLVISCPCALVVSIPLGYFGGVGGASRRGILVKGATYLDVLARVRTVVFDKTGTLTHGTFRVTSVRPRNGMPAHELLRYAALAEAHSNHPIAASIRAAYEGAPAGSDLEGYREIAGQGVTARVDNRVVMAGNDRLLHENGVEHDTCSIAGTAVHLVVDGLYAGYLEIGDEARDDAAVAVKELRRLGVSRTVLLTGDDSAVAKRTAARLGIDEYHGDLRPSEKVTLLEGIMKEPRSAGRTAFVGDGINDAPVLARADVGIAMGASGADAAVETADVVLMSDTLMKVPEAIRARTAHAGHRDAEHSLCPGSERRVSRPRGRRDRHDVGGRHRGHGCGPAGHRQCCAGVQIKRGQPRRVVPRGRGAERTAVCGVRFRTVFGGAPTRASLARPRPFP